MLTVYTAVAAGLLGTGIFALLVWRDERKHAADVARLREDGLL